MLRPSTRVPPTSALKGVYTAAVGNWRPTPPLDLLEGQKKNDVTHVPKLEGQKKNDGTHKVFASEFFFDVLPDQPFWDIGPGIFEARAAFSSDPCT